MRECRRAGTNYMFSKFQSLPSYFGGKRKLVKQIFKPITKTDGVFIDAFLGGGSVSLYAKAKGYKVISNDISFRSYIIGRAIIANNSVKLEDEDLARLFVETPNNGFIRKTYCPKVFVAKTADFLDNAVAAALSIENENKKYLLLHLLIKFILACRQFGQFSNTRVTQDLEARKFDRPLRSRLYASRNIRMIQNPMPTLKKLKDQINNGIFDNHQDNEIHQKDVLDFLKTVSGDVAYFDPPYLGSNPYEVEYGVLEDVLAGKKLANEPSAFNQEAIAEEFFEKMFAAAKHIPQWIISLGQNKKDVGFTPERLLEMVQKHRKAEVQILEHKWIMNNAVGRDQKDNIEYLIVTL